VTTVRGAEQNSSGFQRRGAVFRNVVIICAPLASSLFVASNLIWMSIPKEYSKRDLTWDSVVYSLVPLGLLAIVQVVPRGAWRWVGLVTLVFAGLWALSFLLALAVSCANLPMLFGRGRESFLLLLATYLGRFLTSTLSWLYLGRYCRGWAREFAAAKAAGSRGAGNQESAQKETV
jgi:hypothetical protein